MIYKEYKAPIDLLKDLQRVINNPKVQLLLKVKTILSDKIIENLEIVKEIGINSTLNKFKIVHKNNYYLYDIDTLDFISIVALNKSRKELTLFVSREYTRNKLEEIQNQYKNSAYRYMNIF